MQFSDFCKLVSVMKLLYGRTAAAAFFEKNIDKYKNVVDVSDLSVYIDN